MSYYIKKIETIKATKKEVEIFYQGNKRWTIHFEFRKIYDTEDSARNDLYFYGGEIVSE